MKANNGTKGASELGKAYTPENIRGFQQQVGEWSDKELDTYLFESRHQALASLKILYTLLETGRRLHGSVSFASAKQIAQAVDMSADFSTDPIELKKTMERYRVLLLEKGKRCKAGIQLYKERLAILKKGTGPEAQKIIEPLKRGGSKWKERMPAGASDEAYCELAMAMYQALQENYEKDLNYLKSDWDCHDQMLRVIEQISAL